MLLLNNVFLGVDFISSRVSLWYDICSYEKYILKPTKLDRSNIEFFIVWSSQTPRSHHIRVRISQWQRSRPNNLGCHHSVCLARTDLFTTVCGDLEPFPKVIENLIFGMATNTNLSVLPPQTNKMQKIKIGSGDIVHLPTPASKSSEASPKDNADRN